jgi:hypothetical protein
MVGRERPDPVLLERARWTAGQAGDAQGFGTCLLETVMSTDPDWKPRLTFEPDGFAYEFETALELIT